MVTVYKSSDQTADAYTRHSIYLANFWLALWCNDLGGNKRGATVHLGENLVEKLE